jgi:uncharacterized protein
MGAGIRFECQSGCTACCEQNGFVYLTEADLLRAAEFLGISAAEFERRYVYRSRYQMRLKVPRQASCHFLRDGGCSIHPAKPMQCRTFPFWPDLVESRSEWRKTARYCPGIGKGPLITIQTATAIAAEATAVLK